MQDIGDPMKVEVPKINDLLGLDPYLKPFEREIRRRWVGSLLSTSFSHFVLFSSIMFYKDFAVFCYYLVLTYVVSI